MRIILILALLFAPLAGALELVGGSTDKILQVFVYATDGTAETALAYGSVTVSYKRSGAATNVAQTAVTMTIPTHADWGWAEVDATDAPGLYEFGIPDAAIAAGADQVSFTFTATGIVPVKQRVEITAADMRDGTSLGLSRLDAAISTRLATAGYTAPLDAAGVRTAVGLASANLDTQIAGLPTDADVQTAAAAALTAYDPPTNQEMVDRTLLAASYSTLTAADNIGINWGDVTNPTTTVNLSATTVGVLAGHTPQTGDHTANIALVLEDTGTTIPAAIDALPTAAEIKTAMEAVGSHLALILEDTGTSLPATLSALATAAALTAHDGKLDTVDGIVDDILVIADKLDAMLELDGAVYRYTANALELGPGGGSGGDATAENQTTILDRLAGLMSKDHALGTAVGTFDPATDSNEAIRDRGDAAWLSGAGEGAITYTYTLTSTVGGTPIDDALVEVFTESAMTNKVAQGRTDAFGVATFYLDAGTYYLRRTKSGYNFTNPQTVTVAE